MERISIANCNCIQNADIAIQRNTLNIKYGGNGTGKSTISKAIYAKAMENEAKLNDLKPYGADESICPTVDDLPFNVVKVFDEDYVNSYLFKGDEFFSDSFKVFLKSQEIDNLSSEIETLLGELQNVFFQNGTFQELKLFLPKYIDATKFSNGQVSRRGGVGEFLNGLGAGFENYTELDGYKDYYYNRDFISVSKWAKWRNDGIQQMHGENCPFCAQQTEDRIEQENQVIKRVFKNSAITVANAVIEYLENAVQKGYTCNARLDEIKQYVGNPNKTDELTFALNALGLETDYLIGKIEKICEFRPMSVSRDQLLSIETSLDGFIIDKTMISRFYDTELINTLVQDVQDKVNHLKAETSRLKTLFLTQEAKLNKLIESRENDINHFFSLAGFPYEFKLDKKGENKASAYLIPIANDKPVIKPGERLSWGERNAFALVMFMFEAISDNADLIVLDDPISAFDEHKKFAIIRRMFDNQKASFREKTVLMLTHDLQPIIDYIHGRFFKNYGIVTPVVGSFLQNADGVITEKSIEQHNLCNTIELCHAIAIDEETCLAVRVVNYRKYIEMTNNNYGNDIQYNLLSNLIHGREVPEYNSGDEISEADITLGMGQIATVLNINEYSTAITQLSSETLVKKLQTCNTYEKIISIRLLFERNEGLLTSLRREYPAACKFINETNHVENNYIFQLDPREYFSIPPVYITQLNDFINRELGKNLPEWDPNVL